MPAVPIPRDTLGDFNGRLERLEALEDVDVLQNVESLVDFGILNCRSLTDITGLSALRSTGTFAVTKMVLTGFSVLVLVFLERAHVFNRFRTGVMLSVAFAFYACLVCYEIVLLT